MRKHPSRAFVFFVTLFLSAIIQAASIRELSEHFNDPGADYSPWRFIPQENIKELSTEEHPGLVTLYEAGKGKDIKGILKDPIKIDDYRLPWEFQTSFAQSFNATAGVGAKTQVNYAIGLNIAVTSADPATWPTDRSQRPPDTKEFQLLTVHLGGTGEAGIGLPQYSSEPHPERYLVWGRGNIGYKAMGDWQIPYVWIGDGAKDAGPASPLLYYRCVLRSPTQIDVGIKFESSHGWNMRSINLNKPITGIWEIGPIISGDRWIPDVLCRSLPQVKGPHPLFLGNTSPENYNIGKSMTPVNAPDPETPNPQYEYYVDYCVFFGSSPRPFEEYSDDFNIQGYLGQWQVQEQCTLMDTRSHPGYLMLQLLGPGLGTGFGAAGGSTLSLSDYKPPWEIELCFIGPDDKYHWNFWMNFILLDKQGKQHGLWTPGVENVPKEKRHRLYNQGAFKLEFERDIPEEILGAKPLYMLIQCIDPTHARLGFKAKKEDSWFLSKIYDTSAAMQGSDIDGFGMHCWSTTTGRMYGAPQARQCFKLF